VMMRLCGWMVTCSGVGCCGANFFVCCHADGMCHGDGVIHDDRIPWTWLAVRVKNLPLLEAA